MIEHVDTKLWELQKRCRFATYIANLSLFLTPTELLS